MNKNEPSPLTVGNKQGGIMAKNSLRNITSDDLLGRITPGVTVYKDKNTPLTVKRLSWFGDYCMDVIICDDGHSYPATSLKIAI